MNELEMRLQRVRDLRHRVELDLYFLPTLAQRLELIEDLKHCEVLLQNQLKRD